MSTRAPIRAIGLVVASIAVFAAAHLTPVGSVIAKEIEEVFVMNTDPIAVSIADGEPAQGFGQVLISPGDKDDCQLLYQVPEGKRLTVEFVSVHGYIHGEDNAATATVSLGPEVAIPMASTHTQGETFGQFQTHIYWSGTETVQVFGTVNLIACAYVRQAATADTETFFGFSWSGRLEDLP